MAVSDAGSQPAPSLANCFGASSLGLNALNFCIAGMQTAFGPFVAVWLTRHGWSLTEIGFALSVGAGMALLGQLPGGMLVDAVYTKRNVTAAALLVLAASAALFAASTARPVIWGAETLHALTSCIITPAIAALTLSLCGHARFSQRLGINSRWASLGNAAGAAAMGAAAGWFATERAVFVLSALLLLPALVALFAIRQGDRVSPDGEHPAVSHPRQRTHPPWQIFTEPALHVFAVAAVLFQLANAALLPLALSRLATHGQAPGWVVSACIIVPQAIVACVAPWMGNVAQHRGRRPVLLAGFAALPLRALLVSLDPSALGLVAIQALDGISATVFGLMLPLIAADLTRRTGYLNFAIGSIGLATGIGATFSTSIAGWIADTEGPRLAFLFLAATGAAALALLFLAMPETRPARKAATPRQAVTA